MLLVDSSGSMNNPIVPGCMGTSCITRLNELKVAMNTFLSGSPNLRLGLAFFPAQDLSFTPAGCLPTRSIETPFPARTILDSDTSALNASAVVINQRIQALGAAAPLVGGTPTSASLRFVADAPAVFDLTDTRPDVIVLITDGLPNCNSSNPTSCLTTPAPPVERCTLNSSPSTTSNCRGQYCAAGYLDDTGTVQTIGELRSRGIRTLVVGLGTDFSSALANNTLNAMAAAGGLPRRCPAGTNAECGAGGTCGSSRVCSRQFFAAENSNELAQVLARLPSLLTP
jgi:hypothetical protein